MSTGFRNHTEADGSMRTRCTEEITTEPPLTTEETMITTEERATTEPPWLDQPENIAIIVGVAIVAVTCVIVMAIACHVLYTKRKAQVRAQRDLEYPVPAGKTA